MVKKPSSNRPDPCPQPPAPLHQHWADPAHFRQHWPLAQHPGQGLPLAVPNTSTFILPFSRFVLPHPPRAVPLQSSSGSWLCPQSITALYAQSLSHVQLFVSPLTVAHQVLLFMDFSRQEYWSGLPFPSPGGLPDPGIEPGSPALLYTPTIPWRLRW